MSKISMMLIAVFMFTTLAISETAWANCEMCEAKSAAKEGEIINDTCPVMGGAVDKNTPYKTTYKGKTIGLCCPACIEKFNAEPEKYMAKLQERCIIKCPKCGAEIDVTQEHEKAKAH